jgi:uncharacterized protein YecT (DUF1311 family)
MHIFLIRLSLLGIFLGFYTVQSQKLNIKSCDSLPTQKAINACVFKVYNASQTNLNKAYTLFLKKLDNKIKTKDAFVSKKNKSLKLFLKESQMHWILARDYNAQAKSSFELSPLKADYAFYKSKTLESINRIKYLTRLADSLNLK